MSNPPAPDPDPTTQMAWPTSSNSRESLAIGTTANDAHLAPEERYRAPTGAQKRKSPQRDVKQSGTPETTADIGRARLSTLQLFCLSVSMAGAQVAWTVELGYVPESFGYLLPWRVG